MPGEIIERLMAKVGYTLNTKGYKLLPSHVRVIQGDGITVESLPKILDNLKSKGISTDNLAFGMGGGLLQQVNRDTFKFAMKCSLVVVNGNEVDVFKDPVTDPGKRSKSGRLVLVKRGNTFYTEREDDIQDMMNPPRKNFLVTIYKNKPIQSEYVDFQTVRDRSNENF
jgi:nicotinamide phosphoribosyltransferase